MYIVLWYIFRFYKLVNRCYITQVIFRFIVSIVVLSITRTHIHTHVLLLGSSSCPGFAPWSCWFWEHELASNIDKHQGNSLACSWVVFIQKSKMPWYCYFWLLKRYLSGLVDYKSTNQHRTLTRKKQSTPVFESCPWRSPKSRDLFYFRLRKGNLTDFLGFESTNRHCTFTREPRKNSLPRCGTWLPSIIESRGDGGIITLYFRREI